MTQVEIASLQEALRALPASEQLGFMKGWLARHPDEKVKATFTAFWGLIKELPPDSISTPTRDQIVVLLHGIRTEAVWQSMVCRELSKLPNVKVYPVGYGWLDAFRFWLPFGRMKSKEKILRELRDIKTKHEGSPFTVIAHSFSTFLISEIFNDHPDIMVNKLILCGSIIPRDFRWDKIPSSTGGMLVVNEVGTRDIWPVLARVTSWGYGCSGTMGFQTARVTDRYFDYGHSDFFQENHISKYWVPFVQNGTINSSSWDTLRSSQPWLVQLFGNMPFIKLLILGFLIGLYWLVSRLIDAI